MYSPARSAVSVESEDGWVVWFSAEAPDGKPRRARPPRAPAPKLTVPKPVQQDGGMGQTLGELGQLFGRFVNLFLQGARLPLNFSQLLLDL